MPDNATKRLATLAKICTGKLRREIRERRKAEKALRASLAEKEALLREVRHRVKNNLQLISSLLSLQAMMVEDDQMAAPFLDTQARVQAMAMVQERLYASGDLSQIDFPGYLRELSLFLIHAYFRASLTITPRIECDVESLPADMAIPCGLVLTELVRNCLTHAFAGRETGIVTVLAAAEPAGARLTVADNGTGLPQGFDIAKAHTLGMRLIVNLARQLHGTLHVESGRDGTTVSLAFPVRPHVAK